MEFGHHILKYWDDILKDLTDMVAIPSVSKEGEGNYPFGRDAASAIDFGMELAARYDLQSKNVDYYAMHAEYGEGEENAVVLAHLDVVPAGEGWDFEPYTLTFRDGKAIGRGVGDNKGPAIVALHCLRALKEHKVPAKRKLRVILGSSEETGMDDMAYYFEREQHPDMGFTPDAEYGICNCEKGLFRFRAEGLLPSIVKSFQSGTVANAVPFSANCTLQFQSEASKADAYALLVRAADTCAGEFEITETELEILIKSDGVAGHASTPETGFNAATHLVYLLFHVFDNREMGAFFSFIHEKIGITTDGSKMNLALKDTESGKLTFNLGLVNYEQERGSLVVDIRYPVTATGEEVSRVCANAVAQYEGLQYTQVSNANPLHVSKDSKLIRLLSKSYESVMGKECEMFSMGGGTYAREMFGKGVAFGPSFPDNPDGGAHTANEYVVLENLKKHAQICLEAMYNMLTADNS